jgi:hypothetical protein
VTSVTSLRAHRARALASSALQAAALGAALASRETPPWSATRVLTTTTAGLVVAVDQAALELPPALAEARATGTVGPPPPHERRALVDAGARSVALGVVLQVLDRPARDRLTRAGLRHPHRWLGAGAALAQLALLAPVHWRLGADRARAAAERDAVIEAELQEMLAGN